MAVDIERTLKKRNGLRSKIQALKTGAPSTISPTEANVKLQLLEKLYASFDEVQTDVELLMTDPEELQNQTEIGTATTAMFIEIKTTLMDQIPSNQSQPVTTSTAQTRVKLPEISLPKFDGSIQNWQSFSDLFVSMVKNNNDITSAQKLLYLKTSLQGEALALLDQLEISNDNFEIGWTTLTERYASKRKIVYKYLKTILELPECRSDVDIKNMIDQVNQNLLGLKNIKQPEDSNLLTYVISSKLPSRVIREWERSLKDNDKVPKYAELKEFLKWHVQVIEHEKSDNAIEKNGHSKQNHFVDKGKNMERCSLCKAEHKITVCPKFLKQTIDERWETVRNLGICRKCLKGKHMTLDCKSTIKCNKCCKHHNALLHQDSFKAKEATNDAKSDQPIYKNTRSHGSTVAVVQGESENEPQPGPSAQVLSVVNQQHEIILPTAVGKVKLNNGTFKRARLIFDSCSQIELVSERLAKLSGQPISRSLINIIGVGDSSSSSGHKVTLLVSNVSGTYSIQITAQVLPNVIKNPAPVSQQILSAIQKRHVKLADTQLNSDEPIDILIGAKYFNQILEDGFMDNFPDGITLRNTKFGWTIFGGAPNNGQRIENGTCCFTLSDQLELFWKQEEVAPVPSKFTEEERYCEELFAKTTKFENGKFVVKLPFKNNLRPAVITEQLGNNLHKVKGQLLSLERRFQENAEFKRKYVNFMKEYITLGHMTPLSYPPAPGYYIPHHGVFRKDSEKIRVVFNGSCESDTYTSLNEQLCVGPTIQRDLFNILLSFRNNEVALVGDIEMMYRQVTVAKEDRCFQRILWREHPADELKQYELNTVTYGTAPAPFLAIRCLEQIAKDINDTQPELSQEIRDNFYVDDFASGANTVSSANELKTKLQNTLKCYGFNIRKWKSNYPELCDDPDQNSSTKTLGICWNPHIDSLSYQCPKLDESFPNTKRKVLAEISRLFDPLGFISPIIITAKIFIQSLWRLNIDWDEKLPLDHQTYYYNFRKMLPVICNLAIPRYTHFDKMADMELHVFADASEKAFAAVIYLRVISTQVRCTIIASKTRVAPNAKITVPRLELCAAKLAAELIDRVAKEFKIPTSKCYGWSDSTITLSWLTSHPNRWRQYVANRVATIQGLLPPAQWRHIAGKDNPADLASRGTSVDQLATSQLWWNGPSFLQSNLKPFNNEHPSYDKNADKEKRPQKMLATVSQPSEELINNASSFLSLINRIAYCFRFVTAAKCTPKITGPIRVHEYKRAVLACVKYVQSQFYSKEIRALTSSKQVFKQSPIRKLAPFLKNGILHVGGRLSNAAWAFNKKHPIILPNKSHFTTLLIQFTHVTNLHASPEILLVKLRAEYWIIHARSTIRSVLHRCVTCAKSDPTTFNQKMGNLPLSRIIPDRTFSHVGVDYAGPIQLKSSNLRKNTTTPGYIAVFICMKSKAVHIEVVTSLSAGAFILALRRFIGRRAYPKAIYSDNGTNFTASNHILIKKFGQFLQFEELHNQIQSYLTPKQIAWHFIPPSAPNFGGLWESNVKCIKRIIRRVVGDARLTYEEMNTLLIEIEAILNSRPLSAISNNPNDLTCLTPAHFLSESPVLNIPESPKEETIANLGEKWHQLQQLKRDIWRRWSSEYVAGLQERQNRVNPTANVNVGDLVLLPNNHNAVGHWSLGRIVETFPGNDGLVRVVDVKTKYGTYRRPINKLAMLPCN